MNNVKKMGLPNSNREPWRSRNFLWFKSVWIVLAAGAAVSGMAQPETPQCRIDSLSLGPSGRLRLQASTPADQLFSVQGSMDLAHWRRVTSVPGSDTQCAAVEVDASPSGYGFYRLAREAAMYLFNPQHSGVGDAEPITNSPSLKWKFKTGNAVFSSPAVVGGVVYIGSADTNFYALDAETGVERWHFYATGPVRSSPAVLDGRVYFNSRDGTLYALNASDGSEIWRTTIGPVKQPSLGQYVNVDYFDSSPTVVDGVLYIGSGDKRLYAIDIHTGQTNWTFSSGGAIRSTPALAKGMVYFGGFDGYIYALDAVTGTNRWKTKSPGGVYTSVGEIFVAPVVVGSNVYIGSCDAAVYALDGLTGQREWRRLLNGGSTMIFSSPAIWKDLVVSGTSIPPLFCALESGSGKQKWQLSVPQQPYSSPAVVDGIAYFGCGDVSAALISPSLPRAVPGYFLAVDLTTGKEKWRFRTGGQVYSSPAVADGSIYFGCLDGYVYALH